MGEFSIAPGEAIKAPPLLKWPGGKREILRQLLRFLPQRANRYFEPFLGGGALFFALQPPRSVLSDTNSELINLYQQVKEAPHRLISTLSKYKNTERFYYEIRARSPRTPITRAARLLYLTRLSFNGIHRVNLRGEFNVPYGQKTHLSACDEPLLTDTSKALLRAELRVADFEAATADARSGDLVYFDPPYTVAHAHNGFVKYNEKIFSWDDQVRLAIHANLLLARGCYVVVTNADHPSIHALYRGFRRALIRRVSRIAASPAYRGEITESVYYPAGPSND